jgi:molybdopterin-guanine dinucleotide biosynthesis protein A
MVALLGAVLVGGQSRRMGRDKAFVIVDGVAMGERVSAALRVLCDDVVRVGPGADIVDVRDGPLVALLAVLSSGRAKRYLIAATDQPLLSLAVLLPLTNACGLGDDAVAYAGQPLPLCISAAAHDRVRALVECRERRLRAAVNRWLDAPANSGDLVDVDTPADLAALLLTRTRGRA